MELGKQAVMLIAIFSMILNCQTEKREKKIRAVETRWDNALLTGDGAALKEILADDFVLIDSSGAHVTKSDLIKNLKPSTKKQMKSNHTENVSIRIYGDTAVVTGLYVEDGLYNSKPYRIKNHYTDVYVCQKNSWRGVAAHASGQTITLDGKPYATEEPGKKQ